MNCKRVFVFLMTILFVLAVFVQGVQADHPIQAKMKPFFPGETAELQVVVKGTYDLAIHYWGTRWYGWWGWGSGPATSRFGEQYWMTCGYTGCTEWWRATLPKHAKDLIIIPLTTNPAWTGGVYPNAVTITGIVNGRSVALSVVAKSKD